MTDLKHIHQLRKNYSKEKLDTDTVGKDPIAFFAFWFEEALNSQIEEPNAMVLSTIGLDLFPKSRVVLLKGVENKKFIFYTNYKSAKGQEMEKNPAVALNFNWLDLERQVRIEGLVEKISDAESDAYFNTRPHGSKIGAWVSEQSQPIENRQILDNRLAELESKYAQEDVPRPSWWGGYATIPLSIEFWQGRPNRLHDRIRFKRDEPNSVWEISRLSP